MLWCSFWRIIFERKTYQKTRYVFASYIFSRSGYLTSRMDFWGVTLYYCAEAIS